MSKNTWILWAVILMIPGAVGLGYHFAQKRKVHDQFERAAQATAQSSATDEYLAMYENWFCLSPEEKAENPWGQDPYGGPEIQKRLKQGQSDRLLADIPDLDKGVRHFPDELAETMYGSRWQQAVEEYRRQRSKADMFLIGTVFLLAGSGLLLIGGLGKIAFVYSLSRLKRAKGNQTEQSETSDIISNDSRSNNLPQIQSPDDEDSEFVSFTKTQPASDAEKVIASGRTDKKRKESSHDEDELGYFESRKKVAQKLSPSSDTNKNSFSELSKSLPTSLGVSDKPTKDSYFGWALPDEELSDMETLMTTEPLTKELTELTEEVSAIRQFAAQQQDQVRKLQDGYDWMIIRRFCMRVIRSIDNIEDRIARIDDSESENAMCLEDIRDELVFALESSGIEQFNPELEMPFKGLEKYAEAVRQRVVTEDESLGGCIAEIVRPGYQYLISDDDVKIVRCAQVKLYETQ
ncbi:MAG: nucleotide exchange factor GrpE [Phycisphaerae bacterium]|nr:nucleotide exchange factor GrpE [Phycisphaerae bacterium]